MPLFLKRQCDRNLGNALGNAGLAVLADALGHSNCGLRSLDLSANEAMRGPDRRRV
jgi:hypothetical protein